MGVMSVWEMNIYHAEMFADKEAHTYLLTGLLFVQVKV